MGKIADFSHHQEKINWEKASKELDLVIIRTSYSTTTVDTRCKEYVKGAKKYGVPFGHYHYAMFKTKSQAIAEAIMFVKLADKDAKFLVVDVEDRAIQNANIVQNTQAFIDYVKKATGKKVGLYSGNSYYKENKLNKVKYDFLWIARYSGTAQKGLKPDMSCGLWQYTSLGKVSGVSTNVDLNVVENKSLEYFTGAKLKAHPVKVAQPVKAKAKATKVKAPTTYVVEKGDSLSKIATKFNVTVDELVKWNKIKKPNLIAIGQVLKITKPSVTKKVVKAVTGKSKAKYHIVVSGDTVSGLATRYGSTIAQIKKWNKLDSKYTIRKGQKIRVK